jgi:hypothetical protein
MGKSPGRKSVTTPTVREGQSHISHPKPARTPLHSEVQAATKARRQAAQAKAQATIRKGDDKNG